MPRWRGFVIRANIKKNRDFRNQKVDKLKKENKKYGRFIQGACLQMLVTQLITYRQTKHPNQQK